MEKRLAEGNFLLLVYFQANPRSSGTASTKKPFTEEHSDASP